LYKKASDITGVAIPSADQLVQSSIFLPRGHSEVPVWELPDSDEERAPPEHDDLNQMMTDLLDGTSGINNFNSEWLDWTLGDFASHNV
jgi:hypothetical protein